MQCDEVRRIADLYIDNQLDEDTADSVQRHLFVCATCNHDIETVRTAVALLKANIASEQPTSSFKDRTTAMLFDRLRDHLHTSSPNLSAIQWPLPID